MSTKIKAEIVAEQAQEIRDKLRTDKDWRDRWLGVYIGAIAVLMALCTMSGGNAAKDANKLNIEAANVWSFFQAKNLRRNNITAAADAMELQMAAQPAMPDVARQKYVAKIAEYRALAEKLSTDVEKNEGLDQLWEKAKALEKGRDDAFKRDPYFDWSQAALQIAIVLATVCLVTGNLYLLAMSFGLAVIGAFLMLDGLTLWLPLRFIG
jgi:Domain of unknown function (DUF4337)